jgi:cysteinyl-tRNA synthetase, unknown class
MKKRYYVLLFSLLSMSLIHASWKDFFAKVNYRDAMRAFVIDISDTARATNPKFIVLPQNGIELILNNNPEHDLDVNYNYIHAISGMAQESLNFGHGKPTPFPEQTYLLKILETGKAVGLPSFVIDYCSGPVMVKKSYALNQEFGLISFAPETNALDTIPKIPVISDEVKPNPVEYLSEVRNFLYLINDARFTSKEQFIKALSFTNHDLIVVDLFVHEEPLTQKDVDRLKLKKNGGKRLVLAYMSIGEAEDYRYYWQDAWEDNPPKWLGKENVQWKGNYLVKYWDKQWHPYILGGDQSYLTKILAAGFDGVYLDIVDAFLNFE